MTDALKVLIVILVVWVGLFLYLLKLDRDVARLEKDLGKTVRDSRSPRLEPDRIREIRRVPDAVEEAESK